MLDRYRITVRLFFVVLLALLALTLTARRSSAVDYDFFYSTSDPLETTDGELVVELRSLTTLIDPDDSFIYIKLPMVSDWFREDVVLEDYRIPGVTTYYSEFEFLDDEGSVVGTIGLVEEDEPGSVVVINDFTDDTTFVQLDYYKSVYFSGEPSTMTVSVWLSPDRGITVSEGSEFLEFFNRETEIEVSEDEIDPDWVGGNVFRFYDGFDEWFYTTERGNVPEEPFAPPRGTYAFRGWVLDSTGELYDFETPLEIPEYVPDYNNNTYVLRASYDDPLGGPDVDGEELDPESVPDTSDSRLVAFLYSFGLYSHAGMVLIYFVVATVVSGAGAYLNLPAFAIVVVDLVLAAIWMIAGWFPAYATILLLLAFAVALVATFGHQSTERG